LKEVPRIAPARNDQADIEAGFRDQKEPWHLKGATISQQS
jgi:hypothetical protein